MKPLLVSVLLHIVILHDQILTMWTQFHLSCYAGFFTLTEFMKLASFVFFIPDVLPHNLLMLNKNDVSFQIYRVILRHLQVTDQITIIQAFQMRRPQIWNATFSLVLIALIMHKTVINLAHLLQVHYTHTSKFWQSLCKSQVHFKVWLRNFCQSFVLIFNYNVFKLI